MPIQIKRLLIAFIIFVSIFLVIRQFLIPESFGEFGHYRALSLKENEDHEMKYVGVSTCNNCHDDIVSGKQDDLHEALDCETCHGPGYIHAGSPEAGQLEIPEERESCGRCHSFNPARPKKYITQVDLSEHNVDKKCIQCHNPHKPWDLKEQN
ncbi:MAG: hypothetical protein ABII90_05745 [Bacteroidota bacterium]